MSGEFNEKMAVTNYEVMGVIGVDDVGTRYFRRSEIENSFGEFESNCLLIRMQGLA